MAKTKKKGPSPKQNKPVMSKQSRYRRAKADVMKKKDNPSLSEKENEKAKFFHYFFIFLIAAFAREAMQMVYALSTLMTFCVAIAFSIIGEMISRRLPKKRGR